MSRVSRQSWAIGFAMAQAIRVFLRTQRLSDRTTAEQLANRIVYLRRAMNAMVDRAPPPPGTRIRPVDGPVPGEWVRVRASRPDRVLFYLHGGAYAVCSPATHRTLVRSIAVASQTLGCVPHYRLAPEHRFPAAVDDAVATYRWLLDERGVPPDAIAIAGDSAGGGLGLATMLRARDEGLPMPACYVGLSPWTDLTGSSPSIVENNGRDRMFGRVPVTIPARLGEVYADDTTDPLVSPVFADLTGLPPMLVHVGTHELIRDDGLRLVERARAHGVDASAGQFRGMWHVWQLFPVPEARRSLREIGGFIRRHLA